MIVQQMVAPVGVTYAGVQIVLKLNCTVARRHKLHSLLLRLHTCVYGDRPSFLYQLDTLQTAVDIIYIEQSPFPPPLGQKVCARVQSIETAGVLARKNKRNTPRFQADRTHTCYYCCTSFEALHKNRTHAKYQHQ